MTPIPDSDGYADATNNSLEPTATPMRHVMLDLETYGTKPGCVIRSIAAVTFVPHDMAFGDAREFYSNISLGSCLRAGLTIEPGTADYWDGPLMEDARSMLMSDRRSLVEVIQDFNGWFKGVNGKWVWCHGAGFDAPIWQWACEALNIKPAWDWRDVRDTRTAYHLAGIDGKGIPFDGVPHHALADARHQAKCVQEAVRRLMPTKPPKLSGDVGGPHG